MLSIPLRSWWSVLNVNFLLFRNRGTSNFAQKWRGNLSGWDSSSFHVHLAFWTVMRLVSRHFRRVSTVTRTLIFDHMCIYRGCSVSLSWKLHYWRYDELVAYGLQYGQFFFIQLSQLFCFVLRSVAINSDAFGARFGTNWRKILHKPIKGRSSVCVVGILRSPIAFVMWLTASSWPECITCPIKWIFLWKRRTFSACASLYFL